MSLPCRARRGPALARSKDPELPVVLQNIRAVGSSLTRPLFNPDEKGRPEQGRSHGGRGLGKPQRSFPQAIASPLAAGWSSRSFVPIHYAPWLDQYRAIAVEPAGDWPRHTALSTNRQAVRAQILGPTMTTLLRRAAGSYNAANIGHARLGQYSGGYLSELNLPPRAAGLQTSPVRVVQQIGSILSHGGQQLAHMPLQ